MKTLKSRHALVAGILLALSSVPVQADTFCGPGLKLGAENDCPGCSWLCIPDPNPQPMSKARPAPAGAAGLLQQALSQVEPTDGLTNAGADPAGHGIRSREFNRSAIAALQEGRFMHAALRFRLAAGFARDAGNAREEYVNRRNALLLQLAGKLKAGIEAADRGRMTQAQVSYREAQVVAAQVAAMPLAARPATTAGAVPPSSATAAPNQAAADPAVAPTAPGSNISGLGNAAAAKPRAAKAPARQTAPGPVVARAQPSPVPAAIGQVVAPMLQAARQPQRTPATVQTPAAVAQPAPVAAAPRNSTISSPTQPPSARTPAQPVPATPAPTARTPAAPVVAAPQPAPVAQPVVVQVPPPARAQPVVMQVPATPAPGGGIDPQPVAAVPDPDIDYSGMDPDALINAYGTQDPDYSARNPYNPDPNAGYDPGGTTVPDPSPQYGGHDPGGSPDPVPQYGATAPVAAVRDPDIVCAGGPCTGGAGGYQGGPAIDPGTGALGGPGGGGTVVLPGADPAGGDDLGGVSINLDPTSKPWAAGGDLRSKVLQLTR